MNAKNLFQIVAAEAGKPLASKEEMAELTRFEIEWEKARDITNGCNIEAAYCAFVVEQKALGTAARAGTLHNLHPHTREELERVFLARGEGGRQLMRELHAEAAPLATKVAARFCELAHAIAAREEKAEATRFAQWGIAYQPSALVLALRKLPDCARVHTSDYSSHSPAAMLPFLTL
jgi:hypothetical protein